ncbi:MAG: hypothetical protein A2V46_14690 [Bacteroidetes bacterium RBG_19FT_COMBO_42_7]|nr:MAG: hypothetical protein A2V46_14690 [Bacteroidetes bacterium RBG_19FT_COMBO_42_7]
MQLLKFSGHETFICKQFWLKKGYDYIRERKSFHDDSAVVELGVGRNMVTSINYWLRSFNVVDQNDQPTEFADFIFGENGKDQFIEDIATIWLFHYFLVKTNHASIYDLFFNQFRKERQDFTKEQLHSFLKRKCDEVSPRLYNPNTIIHDINVLLRSYLKPDPTEDKSDFEDNYSGLLIELSLLSRYKTRNFDDSSTINWYKIESSYRYDLPYQIVLFSILDNFVDQQSISFKQLEVSPNSPGLVFALSPDALYSKIEEIVEHNKKITFSNNTGVQELQFKSVPDKWKLLEDYYG